MIQFHPDSTIDPGLPPWVSASLVERAIKTIPDVSILTHGRFVVAGNSSMGDAYDEYKVSAADVNLSNRWECSCQQHAGGEFRNLCRHILACMAVTERRSVTRIDSLIPIIVPRPGYTEPILTVRLCEPVENCLSCWRECYPHPKSGAYPHCYRCFEELISKENPKPPVVIEYAGIGTTLAPDPTFFEPFMPPEEEPSQAIVFKPESRDYGPRLFSYRHIENADLFAGLDDTPDHGFIPEVESWDLDWQEGDEVDLDCLEHLHHAPDPILVFCPQVEDRPQETPSQKFPHTGPVQCIPISSLVLPAWCPGLRTHQAIALEKISELLAQGKRHIIMDAPTGSGKSLIGYLVSQLMGARMNYIATTKELQRQMLKDSGELAKLLMGQSNYATADNPYVRCDQCDWSKSNGCSYCLPFMDSNGDIIPYTSKIKCPYRIAKRLAQESPIAILNTTYALTCFTYRAGGFDNVQGQFGFCKDEAQTVGFAQRGISVYDECHELVKQLMGFVEVEISARILDYFRHELPGQRSRWKTRITWLEELRDKIDEYLTKQAEAQPLLDNDKFIKQCEGTWQKVRGLLKDLEELKDEPEERRETWVYDENEADNKCSFKPVMVNRYGAPLLANHSHRNLFMSATVFPEQFAKNLGLNWEECGVVVVPNTFPKQRGPCFYRPIAANTFKEKNTAIPKINAEIWRIRQTYRGRMLVHTVSYSYMNELWEYLNSFGFEAIRHNNTQEDKNRAVNDFINGGEYEILLSPSMTTGVDFKDDKCRINVIPKFPYLSTQDRQVSRRMYQPTPREGDLWYKQEGMIVVEQSYGRSTRSETDWSRTFVLDASFGRVHREIKHTTSHWFNERIVTDNIDPLITLGVDLPLTPEERQQIFKPREVANNLPKAF